uniref:serine/threonine-protein kinase Nek3-like isoform X1 n=1 Tax=Callithrix jacchus TaxID=9483 RepID=UPI0023DD3444|nr:serine/threonine-protein kinase Nek3-like isoform X1 [Callithrix jacchus]
MDEYMVLRGTGEGSFGRALLVQHESSNQMFAIKEIRLPKSFSSTQNSRKEAVLLAKMKHPNIVAFKESFEAEGHLYIVMEYCDGGDLMQKIKQQKGKLFPEDMILNWFTQMCLGVNHIHKKCVLHRDIKSKNIFLTQNGKVKLGDFGSARLLSTYVSLFYRSDSEQNIHFQECSVVILCLFMILVRWHLLVHTWEHHIMCLQKFGKTCLITIKGEWCIFDARVPIWCQAL